MNKIAAAYVLFDDIELLPLSLDSTLKVCDKVFLLINRKPWRNAENAPPNDSAIQYCQNLTKSNNKIEVHIGEWLTEHETRNYGLDICKEQNIDYCLIIDSDEIYDDLSLANLKSILAQNTNNIPAFHTYWNTYWKTQPLHVIEPRENFSPLIACKANQFRFYDKRAGISLDPSGLPTQNYQASLLSPHNFICHHLSYARSDEYIKKKISYFSHSHEIVKDWYEKVWLTWKPGDKNLHPVNPSQYQKAVKQDLNLLPPVLKKYFEDLNKQPQYKLDSHIMDLLK